MIALDLDRLWMIAPRAQPDYKRAFLLAPQVFPAFEITTPLRAAHFLAQVLHETAGLTLMMENMTYTTPERLHAIFRRRFPTVDSAKPYVRMPMLLANRVYHGINGNVGQNDGWLYRGHGLIQLTGRENYAVIGRELGIDLEDDPEKAIDPIYALAVAACYWKLHGCNVEADEDDLQGVTRRINPALAGIAERRTWLQQARSVVDKDSEVNA